MPVEQLIRKHGEDDLVEFALVSVKCVQCGNLGAKATLVKLCEPGCAKQRG